MAHRHNKPKLDFSEYPSIFVLPTRFTTAELKDVVQDLKQHQATLTGNLKAARVIVVKVNTPKRVKYELRSKGLHLKDLESEGEKYEEEDLVHVVRAEWIKLCLEERRLLPLKPFTLLIGLPAEGTEIGSPAAPRGLKRAPSILEREDSTKRRLLILERAKEDAKKAAKKNAGPPWKNKNRGGELEDIKAAHKPILYRKTTEEWETEQKDSGREEPKYVKEGACISTAM